MTLVADPSDRVRTLLWLRGLTAVAWADGHLDDEEREIITSLTHEPLDLETVLEPLTPEELAAEFGEDPHHADNFLRTAVMVAIADGMYSDSEDHLIRQFSAALGREIPAFAALQQTLNCAEPIQPPTGDRGDVLAPVRHWLDGLEIQNPKVAHFLCKMIPSQCPFERDVVVFGRKLAHIPPMCKLNPLYEQMVGLRFRALSYLADDCGEDVTHYCS